MRIRIGLQLLSLIVFTSINACPFGHAADAGSFDSAEKAKYETVKCSERESQSSTAVHENNNVLVAKEVQEHAKRGLLPGLTLSGLTLPLGGGLRTH